VSKETQEGPKKSEKDEGDRESEKGGLQTRLYNKEAHTFTCKFGCVSIPIRCHIIAGSILACAMKPWHAEIEIEIECVSSVAKQYDSLHIFRNTPARCGIIDLIHAVTECFDVRFVAVDDARGSQYNCIADAQHSGRSTMQYALLSS